MSRGDLRQAVVFASRAPLVRGTLLFSLGAAIAIAFVGNPQLLEKEAAADWASAIGSFIAAVVALALGVVGLQIGQRQERERQHNAAVVFLGPIQEGLAALEAIDDCRAAVAQDFEIAAHFKSKIQTLPEIMTPENLAHLAYLQSESAQYVMLASHGLKNMKTKLHFVTEPQALGQAVLSAEAQLLKVYLPLGNLLQRQSFSSSETPWRQR